MPFKLYHVDKPWCHFMIFVSFHVTIICLKWSLLVTVLTACYVKGWHSVIYCVNIMYSNHLLLRIITDDLWVLILSESWACQRSWEDGVPSVETYNATCIQSRYRCILLFGTSTTRYIVHEDAWIRKSLWKCQECQGHDVTGWESWCGHWRRLHSRWCDESSSSWITSVLQK